MVYDAHSLDIEAVKNDGSVELFIISSGKFDDSAEQQKLLLDKTENYIGYALSEEFKKAYPTCPKERVCIVLCLDKKPSALLKKLTANISSWVNSYGIHFRVEYKSFWGTKKY